MPADRLIGSLQDLWQRLRQPARPQLLVHQGLTQPQTVDLLPGQYRIGRDSNLDVVIDNGAVSREHALLEGRGRTWVLRDAGSTNGLWWQGRRIRELLLNDGDRVQLGPPSQADLPTLQFSLPPLPELQRLRATIGWMICGGLGCGATLLLLSAALMPIRGSLATVRGPLALYDRNGRPISSLDTIKHRELGGLSEYPGVLVDALLASEDSRFWWHPGVDPIGTARALFTNLLGGRVLQGAAP